MPSPRWRETDCTPGRRADRRRPVQIWAPRSTVRWARWRAACSRHVLSALCLALSTSSRPEAARRLAAARGRARRLARAGASELGARAAPACGGGGGGRRAARARQGRQVALDRAAGSTRLLRRAGGRRRRIAGDPAGAPTPGTGSARPRRGGGVRERGGDGRRGARPASVRCGARRKEQAGAASASCRPRPWAGACLGPPAVDAARRPTPCSFRRTYRSRRSTSEFWARVDRAAGCRACSGTLRSRLTVSVLAAASAARSRRPGQRRGSSSARPASRASPLTPRTPCSPGATP